MIKLLTRCAYVTGFAVAALLVYGFWIWLSYPKSAHSTSRTEDFPSLFQQQLQVAGEGEAQTAVDSVQLVALDSAVERFRKRAVTASDTKAMTTLADVAPGALDDLLRGPVTAKYPYVWPYVLSGSYIVIGAALSDDPVVAFYNPWFDIVLLTKWSFKAPGGAGGSAGFRLMQAIPVSGRAFLENRPSLANDQPIWSDSQALFELRIVDASHQFVAEFEKRYPPFGRESAALSADAAAIASAIAATEYRVFDLMRWVIDARNADAPVNYAEGIDQLHRALSGRSPDQLRKLLPNDNPQSAESFFQLAPEVRQGLIPYLVIDKNVIFLDPKNLPTGFLSVYFAPAGKSYAPALVAFFNLAASYSSH
jgi:hypothetical protein